MRHSCLPLTLLAIACGGEPPPESTRADSAPAAQPAAPTVFPDSGYRYIGERPSTEDWARADSATVRLPADSFPELPQVVREDLRKRGCMIPQSPYGEARDNVITGAFVQAGQRDWAVLCSIALTSRILVYRAGATAVIDTLGATADADFLQTIGNNRIGFSRVISPVSRQYIEEHAAAYGGPKPPPIDHDGIDDAFAGKASGIHYFYQGKWIGLQGAD